MAKRKTSLQTQFKTTRLREEFDRLKAQGIRDKKELVHNIWLVLSTNDVLKTSKDFIELQVIERINYYKSLDLW
ncbi:MAG: hypothetical protein HC917_06415 [Richelia sp. SM2_1_7]|nr:hypothetical protein [Richelia sp. SM2_1_7]